MYLGRSETKINKYRFFFFFFFFVQSFEIIVKKKKKKLKFFLFQLMGIGPFKSNIISEAELNAQFFEKQRIRQLQNYFETKLQSLHCSKLQLLHWDHTLDCGDGLTLARHYWYNDTMTSTFDLKKNGTCFLSLWFFSQGQFERVSFDHGKKNLSFLEKEKESLVKKIIQICNETTFAETDRNSENEMSSLLKTLNNEENL